MSNNETMLSKEDYLALSTEYQKEKEIIRENYRTYMIMGIVVIFFGVLLVPLLLATTHVPPIAIIAIGLIVGITGIVITAVNESNMKRKPEELGVRYYQKYVEEYKSSHKE